ncbi:MAG: hypothetical protein A3E80_02265 [Chlamydiae bacterium RIFCSPHIGHO2_12_FULL_49_9]|nr:MAG: hypothetical protein A3E80_02265 [Chlamydiae bacterium RIFCSPHIGHO2_12_FULL_49_9]
MQPKVYTSDEHRIPADKIDQHAFYVIQKLRQAGHKAYLVGGGVRDLLLNQRPKDFDVSTSARPEEIRSLFRNAILIGRRFRLAHIRFGRKVIEVSTFRSGDTESAGLIVRDNEWGTEEQDVLRRDFTINGLFYDPENQMVIDYVEGYLDLEKRVLRTIGQPEVRFIQDPVRMIRLIKFCARFNFDIDKPTFEALLSCKQEIIKSSQARIFEELLRMLESGSAKPFFHLLNQYGLLKALSPALGRHLDKDPEKLLYPLLEEIDSEVRKNPPAPLDRCLLLAALVFPLFHDHIRKEATSRDKPLHLGQIAEEANRAIDEIFHPFFNIPRRMRGIITFLLTTQVRLVPLEDRGQRRPRVPRDPLFPMALQLLKMRTAAHPELLPAYTLWTEASFSSHDPTAPSPVDDYPRRKRRRRRRGRRRPGGNPDAPHAG